MVLQDSANQSAELAAGSWLDRPVAERLNVEELGDLVQALSELIDPRPRLLIVLPEDSRPALAGKQGPDRYPPPPGLVHLIGRHRPIPVASLLGGGHPTPAEREEQEEQVAFPDLAQALFQGRPDRGPEMLHHHGMPVLLKDDIADHLAMLLQVLGGG